MKITGILILLLIVVSQSFGQIENRISEIKNKFASFEYNTVIQQADLLLKEDLSDDKIIEILVLKGASQFSIQETDQARKSFIEILKREKEFQLDASIISPKIVEFFNDVKSEYIQIVSDIVKKPVEPVDSSKIDLSGIIHQERNLFKGSIVRSVLLPGTGHIYLGSKTKGWILTSLSSLTLGATIYYALKTNNKEKDYINEINPLLIDSKYEEFNSAYNTRNILFFSYLAVWIYSQIDLLFFNDDLFNIEIENIPSQSMNAQHFNLVFRIQL